MFTLAFLSVLCRIFCTLNKPFVFTALFICFLKLIQVFTTSIFVFILQLASPAVERKFIDNFYLIILRFCAMCKCLTRCESIHFLDFYASLASFKLNWLIDTFFMFWRALVRFSWENWWKSVKRKINLFLKHIQVVKSKSEAKIGIRSRQIMIDWISNKS